MASKLAGSGADMEEGPGGSGGAVRSPSRAKVDAQLQEAALLKAEGNAFYKDKKLRPAIGRYHRALLVLRSLDPEVMRGGFGIQPPDLTPGQEEALRATQTDCYNNLAACLLQRQPVDLARVQQYCQQVLRWRPGDVKALYRAGVASLELGDAQAAKQYLTQASRGQPNDANVRRQLQRANQELSLELQMEKALYRGMFTHGEEGPPSQHE